MLLNYIIQSLSPVELWSVSAVYEENLCASLSLLISVRCNPARNNGPVVRVRSFVLLGRFVPFC